MRRSRSRDVTKGYDPIVTRGTSPGRWGLSSNYVSVTDRFLAHARRAGGDSRSERGAACTTGMGEGYGQVTRISAVAFLFYPDDKVMMVAFSRLYGLEGIGDRLAVYQLGK